MNCKHMVCAERILNIQTQKPKQIVLVVLFDFQGGGGGGCNESVNNLEFK